MIIALYILITVLGLTSYGVGVKQMINNTYAPSTFSRVIWLLLSVNSLVGVILSQSSESSILLAGIIVLGSLAICITSFWKGTRTYGKLEYFCLFLLILSAIVWIFYDAPLVNVGLSLFAHFVGGLPTYKRVLENPLNESKIFWLLFFLSSLLSVFASESFILKLMIVPIFFTIFDGSMFLLTLRNKKMEAPALSN